MEWETWKAAALIGGDAFPGGETTENIHYLPGMVGEVTAGSAGWVGVMAGVTCGCCYLSLPSTTSWR